MSKPTPSQLAALIEGVRRYSEDEISFYELKDLIDEVETAKTLFDQKMMREITTKKVD